MAVENCPNVHNIGGDGCKGCHVGGGDGDLERVCGCPDGLCGFINWCGGRVGQKKTVWKSIPQVSKIAKGRGYG